jgi:hypothetical protein
MMLAMDGSSLMALHVQRQMVGSGEAAVTVAAFERLTSGVFAKVSGQFVGSGEAPLTSVPTALVWLFARMCSQMGFQMRTFCVHLFAAIVLTLVYSPAQLRPLLFQQLFHLKHRLHRLDGF